jgi:hypothetical protein
MALSRDDNPIVGPRVAFSAGSDHHLGKGPGADATQTTPPAAMTTPRWRRSRLIAGRGPVAMPLRRHRHGGVHVPHDQSFHHPGHRGRRRPLQRPSPVA